jgi:hypothetical protein
MLAIAYRFVESLPHETPLKRLQRRTLYKTLSTKGFILSNVEKGLALGPEAQWSESSRITLEKLHFVED